MGPIRAVLLDMGGTLYYEAWDFEQTLARLLAEAGLSLEEVPTPGEIYRSLGLRGHGAGEASLEAAAALYLALAGERPTPARVEEIHGLLVEHVASSLKPYKWTRRVLEELAEEGYRLVVVSNASTHRAVVRALEREGLLDFFDAVVTSRLVGVRKPDHRIFHFALHLVGARPGEAVHVGDSPYEDVFGAKNAGLRAVQVLRRNSVPSRLADLVLRSVERLPEALRALGGPGSREV